MFCVVMILVKAAEPREDVISVILKRLGVSKPVMVMRDLQLYGVYCLTTLTLMTLIFWGLFYKESISLLLFYMFMLIYFVQAMGRQIAMQYCLPQKM